MRRNAEERQAYGNARGPNHEPRYFYQKAKNYESHASKAPRGERAHMKHPVTFHAHASALPSPVAFPLSFSFSATRAERTLTCAQLQTRFSLSLSLACAHASAWPDQRASTRLLYAPAASSASSTPRTSAFAQQRLLVLFSLSQSLALTLFLKGRADLGRLRRRGDAGLLSLSVCVRVSAARPHDLPVKMLSARSFSGAHCLCATSEPAGGPHREMHATRLCAHRRNRPNAPIRAYPRPRTSQCLHANWMLLGNAIVGIPTKFQV